MMLTPSESLVWQAQPVRPATAGSLGSPPPHTIGDLTREALRSELAGLRKEMRNDLREELSSALAGMHAGEVRVAELSTSIDPPIPNSVSVSSPQENQVDKLRLTATPGNMQTSDASRPASTPVEMFRRGKAAFEIEACNPAPREVRFGTVTSHADSVYRNDKSVARNSVNSDVAGGHLFGNAWPEAIERHHSKELKSHPRTKEAIRASIAVAHVDESRSPSQPGINVKRAIRQRTTIKSGTVMVDKEEEEAFTWAEIIEILSGVSIVLYGACYGVQTEHMANKQTEDVPIFFFVSEILFCIVFFLELVAKIRIEGKDFYKGHGANWNIFDAFLVTMQIIDILLETTKFFTQGRELTFLRLLRILRVLRVMRLVRLLKFFGQLNMVTSAISNSLMTLFDSVMLLLLLMYIVGIAFTGAATSHIVEMKRAGQNPEGSLVDIWWSNLGRSMLSLYESILGGADWNDLFQGLFEINAIWGLFFLVYIAFMMLTMLNVITGIFVESAVKHAIRVQEKSFEAHMRGLFQVTDADHSGSISRDEFEMQMEKPGFLAYMREVGIEPREARLLFDLLDLDKSNGIDAEEFLAGMVRLRAGAKFIDIMCLMREHEQQSQNWQKLWSVLQERVSMNLDLPTQSQFM